MIVCLVTDRHRVDPIEQARSAAAAGIDLIQVRERDMDARPLAALVTAVLDNVRGSATRVLVNDRLDVALVCGAHGVHLRADSIPPHAARTIAPEGFLVGCSVHATDEARRASKSSDYLIAGTVFPSASKPHATSWLGIDGLRSIAEAVAIPVLAIGGITIDRLDAIAGTGAAGIAGIGLFGTPSGIESMSQSVRMRFDSLKRGFLT